MNVNVNQTRTANETQTEAPNRITRDSHPTGVTEHDDDYMPRKKDAKRTLMVVFGFVAALAMLIGLNMK